jgi:histidinol-phosphatase (PHP family)
MFWDMHMHTHHSGDSEASPLSMVQAARAKGLDGLCFTDHYDYDYPDDPSLFLLDFEAYHKEIEEIRAQYAPSFPIRWGIELGLQPQVVEENRRVTQSWPFDFVIGSSHVVHGFDPYYPQYYEGRSEDTAYREYFTSILENLQTNADFDVYGHIDYVVRYGPNQNRFYSYQKYADVIDEILRTLIARGKGIELNTAGYKYGLGHPNPTEEILSRYRELGGEILTIGSDAHAPEQVAYAFDRVKGLLMQSGFRYYTVFEARKPVFLPLDRNIS